MSTGIMDRAPYPEGVPTKFAPNGTVQRYPGNTTVCHIPATSSILPGLQRTYEALGSHPMLSRAFRLLPQDSWHMTTLDGVREIECEPNMWPEGMAKQPLDISTEMFSKSLRQLGLELEKEGLAPPYHMRVRGFAPVIVGLGLDVVGATEAEEQRMRRLRDRLADAMGFKAPNHLTYQFHVTIAYLLQHVDGEDRAEMDRVLAELEPGVQMEFELGAVEFCTFENMLAFPRQFYLGGRES